MNVMTAYIQHIDDLKNQANFKTTVFCSNICSDRQYRRYLSGENLPTQERLHLFLSKLGITPNEFYNSFYTQDKNELSILYKGYNEIISGKHPEAMNTLSAIRKRSGLSEHSKRFLELCNIMLAHRTNQITSMNATDKLKKLIDYPNVLSKKSFTFLDIAAFNQIALIMVKHNNFEYIEELYDIVVIKKSLYLSSSNRYMLPAIYLAVSKSYGIKRDLSRCLEVAEEGIRYSLKINDSSQLSNLYYLASFCNFKMGNIDKSEEYAKKSIAICIGTDDKANLNLLSRLYREEQMMSFDLVNVQK